MTRSTRKPVGVYARMYVSMLRNAKLVDRTDLAWRLYNSAILWCRDEGNDGHIPEAALVACIPGRTKPKLIAAAAELEDAGLWDRNGTGWLIHDYQEFQDGSETIAENRTRKRHAALTRWGNEPEP